MEGKTATRGLEKTWRQEGMYVFEGSDCIAICDTDHVSVRKCEKRARLMAAAPDLLEAAIPFAVAHTYFDIPDDVIVLKDEPNNLFITAGEIRALKAAISKANSPRAAV